jgi:ubiquinol-cytochrome c reductase cytochrome c subunit
MRRLLLVLGVASTAGAFVWMGGAAAFSADQVAAPATARPAAGAHPEVAAWPSRSESLRSAGDVGRGKQLFLSSCAACHGAGGVGTEQGPPLINVGAAAASFQLTTGRMPLANPKGQPVRKPPAFNQRKIDDLVAYVASLGHGPPIPDVDPARGDLSEGGTLFRLNCAACHSSAGVGGALSYGSDAPSLRAATSQQIAEAMRTGPGQMPVFGRDTLSKHQVDSITRYVKYLQHPDDPGGFSLGRIGPITEGMVALLLGIPLLLFVCVRIEESHERQR